MGCKGLYGLENQGFTAYASVPSPMSYMPEYPWVVFKADKFGPAPSHINRLVCKPCTYIKT